MGKQRLTEEQINEIEIQIGTESIPYIYDTKEYPVEVIVSKFQKDQIFVPLYQRKFVWSLKQKSKFIESVFLGVPIMPFLVSVSGDEAELEIIDGSQRIRTLVDYCSDRFKLGGLDKLTSLNNTKFSDLKEVRKNKFKLRDFRFHVVTDNATPDVRADIFNRVNTSSNKLSPSETRKGAYQGDFYNFILECAKLGRFHKVCPIPDQKALRGEYEELVLRFFAYSESYLNFKHDVGPFLDSFVISHNKSFDRDKLLGNFNRMIDFVETNFEPPYIARKGRDNATPRVRYEAISVGVHLALENNPLLTIDNTEWLESKEFKNLTTSDASNNQGKLKARIEFVRDCLLNNINSADLKYE